MQASICSGTSNNNNNNTQICKAHIVGWWNPNLRRRTSIVSVQILRQVITNVNSKELKPADTFNWVVINDQRMNTELWNWSKKHFFGLRVINFHGILGIPNFIRIAWKFCSRRYYKKRFGLFFSSTQCILVLF